MISLYGMKGSNRRIRIKRETYMIKKRKEITMNSMSYTKMRIKAKWFKG